MYVSKMCIDVYTYTYTNACLYMHAYAYKNAYMYACMLIYIFFTCLPHTYMHKYTHVCIYPCKIRLQCPLYTYLNINIH